MPSPLANSNFQSLGGVSAHEGRDDRYRAYRRDWFERPARMIASDFPLNVDVEASSRCNLRCVFCDKRTPGKPHHGRDMDMALYRDILAEAGRMKLCALKLSYTGEPLLHPNIVEMVRLAKEQGVLDVYFNTNGMLLDHAMSQGLIDAGLDRLSISVEGTDPAAFEAARLGADFERIEQNIETMMSLKRRLNRGPCVRVQTVRLPGLDLDEYRGYWSSRCNEVAVVDFKSQPAPGRPCPGWACPQLWQRLTVDSTGNILMCNNADTRTQPLGHASSLSLAEAWRHPRLLEARLLHKRGLSHYVRACSDCPWRNAQSAKTEEGEKA